MVQMLSTAAALRKIGVDAHTFSGPNPDLTTVAIVHGFGLNTIELRVARRLGIRTVLSTIYWSRTYRAEIYAVGGRAPTRTLGRLRTGAILAKAALFGPNALARRAAVYSDADLVAAYESADLLLPNSVAEARSIQAELGVTTPMRVVPNAVDEELLDLRGNPREERSTVLCLGRLEPHKNQLGVIRALSRTGLPVEIVGPVHPHHQRYETLCREAAAGSNVRLVGPIEHSNLGPTLSRARVSVLASWFETTGLASLEAGAAGANVVTTDRGHAREYFSDLAWYCNPAHDSSIRTAVMAAWETPPNGRLRARIAQRFTWRHAADATLDGYRAVLNHDYETLTSVR